MSILFTEEPLVLNVALACEIGVNEAIVLQQVDYWLKGNKKRKQNFRNGYYWTYNTYEKWQEENFPFWSVSTVKRTFQNLEKMGLLISSTKMNSRRIDRTKWYTIDYKSVDNLGKSAAEPQSDASGQIDPLVGSDCSDGGVKMDRPSAQNGSLSITETSSENSPKTTSDIIFDDDEKGAAGENFEINGYAFNEFVLEISSDYPDLFDKKMFTLIYQQMVIQKCDLFTVDEAIRQVKRMKNYGLEKISDFSAYFVGGILRNRLSKQSALAERKLKKAALALREKEEKSKAAAAAAEDSWAPRFPFYNWLEN
jgi:hypothetical protein